MVEILFLFQKYGKRMRNRSADSLEQEFCIQERGEIVLTFVELVIYSCHSTMFSVFSVAALATSFPYSDIKLALRALTYTGDGL